jgi:hypothetical protein
VDECKPLAHGNKAKVKTAAGDAWPDSMFWQQESHCNVTSWVPFTESTGHACAMPKPVKSKSTSDATSLVGWCKLSPG